MAWCFKDHPSIAAIQTHWLMDKVQTKKLEEMEKNLGDSNKKTLLVQGYLNSLGGTVWEIKKKT